MQDTPDEWIEAPFPVERMPIVLRAYDLRLSLSLELTSCERGAFDASGASWDSKLGAYRMKIAAQEGRISWRGVGCVRGHLRNFQFELSIQMSDSKRPRSMQGTGTVRSDGSTVCCTIWMGEKVYRLIHERGAGCD